MRRVSYAQAAFWGGFTGAGVIALTYLGHDLFNLPDVASDFFEFITRIMPGPLITGAIDLMVRIIMALRLGPTSTAAKQAESAVAVVEFLAAAASFGLLIAAFWESGHHRTKLYGLSGGLLFTAITMLVNDFLGFDGSAPVPSLFWLLFVYIGWGLILARLVVERSVLQTEPAASVLEQAESASAEAGALSAQNGETKASQLNRRQFLLLVVAGVLTTVITALRINFERTGGEASHPTQSAPAGFTANAADTSGFAQSPPETILEKRFTPVTGTRLELTPAGKFYRVDINLEVPQIDMGSWRLAVDGLVDKPLALSLNEIRSFPSVSQAITLECISNPVGGDLISSGVWTGVRLKDLLQEAGLKANVKEVYLEAVDSFYESIPLADIQDERTLLVYAMDGQPLTADHGFPLRIYIPNRHGMKQPKWINHLKAIDYQAPGYWVDRGWSREAIVNTTAVIDLVAVNEKDQNSGLVPVGGIAYAGARGISKVEIRVDDYPFQAAELRDPPLSPLTWVQWRYFWLPTPGKHTLMARAADGAGELQQAADNGTYPNGATGYYRVTVNI